MRSKYKVDYLSGDGIVEILVRDHTGKREAKFAANQSDTKRLREIGRILKTKFGIDLTPSQEAGFFDY